MSGPMHAKVDANTTMSFKNFDDLTGIERKYNKGTLVLKSSGKTKTLSCVNHHHLGFNLSKVSQQQIKDLRTEFAAAVRGELDAIALKLVDKDPGRRDEILAKFKEISDSFDKKILMPSWNKPPELSRMDIRALASDVKKLRHVTVDCLLQLGADELTRLASDEGAAAKARHVKSGESLVARRDACLDQLRMQIGMCDAKQLEAAADVFVKALVPDADKLLDLRRRAVKLVERLSIVDPDEHVLFLHNAIKDFDAELGTSGSLLQKVKNFETDAKAKDPKEDIRIKTITFAIGVLTAEVDRRLSSVANKVNTALKSCGIKTFSVLTGIDQFLVDLKDESDLGTAKADVCKLARALGALPPDKDHDTNGLGKDFRLEGTNPDEDKEAQAFRAAFGGKNEEAKIIDNLETVRTKMSAIVGSRQEAVRWSMSLWSTSKAEMTSGSIKPMPPMTVQERLASRKDYAAKILDSLRTMSGSGRKDLEARRELLGRICDDMYEEFVHLVDNDMKTKRKMFVLGAEDKGYAVVKEISDEDFQELYDEYYDEYAKGFVDFHKEMFKGMVNDWKARLLEKVKADDNLAAMVSQVKEALGVCPNMNIAFDSQALQEKQQTVNAVDELARAISDKTWNGDWDATVKQRVLQPEDK